MSITNRLEDWLFMQVHTNNLVYNTCWEDPRCDHELLQFDEDSEIVMITSAGCNALSYLTQQPKQIHCIDMNPRQNALLQFKLSLFKNTNHKTLFQFFGKGFHPEFNWIYEKDIRKSLNSEASDFWDKNINYFSKRGFRKNFYHRGTSGTAAWMTKSYLKLQKQLYKDVKALLDASSLKEQTAIYNQIETRFSNRVIAWALNRHLTMCLLGVPKSQQNMFIHTYENGALGFIQNCLRQVFTEIPIQDNYFYRVYVNGEYTQDCCPDYLKQTHFETLQANVDRVKTYSTTISDFLKRHPNRYSHYILLDHQDWLAENNQFALEEEWDLILKNSRPGTKILLRSAAEQIGFFPTFVKDRLLFEETNTKIQHQLDRVGTYASVYLGIVQ